METGQEETPKKETRACRCSKVSNWLQQQQTVSAMSVDEAAAELSRIDKPETPSQIYYFGLLNQQLGTSAGAIRARFAFVSLAKHEDLDRQQRQLIAILEHHNAERISWLESQTELERQRDTAAAQLGEANEQKALLEQKIEALTEVETSISTRKELE
ncbi:hypothetical protein [Haliea sp. E17]|uniref:hypothetical protein n=1 Tax=Haliea sp. E17 TaxID=3401576 RepID=UPI003AAE88A6